MRLTWITPGICLLAFTTTGCERSPTTPVRGIVKLDGQPLAGASVVLIASEGGRDARGFTGPDGVFQLTTFHPNDGALPGRYKVIVQPPAPTRPGAKIESQEEAQQSAPPEEPAAPPLPFSLPDQTPLVQDIPADREILFDLKSN